MKKVDRFYFELGKRIRKARIKQNLTQQQLAELVSLNRTSITNIEKGVQRLLAHTVVDLAAELKVPIESILPNNRAASSSMEIDRLFDKTSSPEERDFLESALNKISKG